MVSDVEGVALIESEDEELDDPVPVLEMLAVAETLAEAVAVELEEPVGEVLPVWERVAERLGMPLRVEDSVPDCEDERVPELLGVPVPEAVTVELEVRVEVLLRDRETKQLGVPEPVAVGAELELKERVLVCDTVWADVAVREGVMVASVMLEGVPVWNAPKLGDGDARYDNVELVLAVCVDVGVGVRVGFC